MTEHEADADDPVVTRSDGVVTLRRLSRDDAGFIADACADPAILRYSVPHDRRGHPTPLSIADAEAAIDEFSANWRAFAATGTPSGCAFAITDARSGEVAGVCGVDDWSKEDVAQIGYWLAASARGRGYATRAVILMTRWLFELGAARVFLTIVAGNETSVEVARRAGFVYEGTMRAHGVWQDQRCDVLWFAALPLEWLGAHGGDDMSHINRFDHVGITVADLDAATQFFVALGLELEGRTFVEGEFIDTVIGIPGSRTEIVMLRTPDNGTSIELSSFVRPSCVPGSPAAMANEIGLRSVAFEVHDLDAAVDQTTSAGYGLVGGIGEYEGAWRMAYVRGPDGIIVALAQRIGEAT